MISSASPQPPSPTGERDEERERKSVSSVVIVVKGVILLFLQTIAHREKRKRKPQKTNNQLTEALWLFLSYWFE